MVEMESVEERDMMGDSVIEEIFLKNDQTTTREVSEIHARPRGKVWRWNMIFIPCDFWEV